VYSHHYRNAHERLSNRETGTCLSRLYILSRVEDIRDLLRQKEFFIFIMIFAGKVLCELTIFPFFIIKSAIKVGVDMPFTLSLRYLVSS